MKLVRNTPEEEAAIQAGIAADPDNPEWTDTDFAQAVRVQDMTPAQLTAMVPPAGRAAELRRRGAQRAARKSQITIRLDADLVERLRAMGQGWQVQANTLLRKAVGL